MTIAEVLSTISKALNDIQPEIDLIDFDNKGKVKPVLVISVVSGRFRGLPGYVRIFMVDEMIRNLAPAIYRSLELAYQCSTEDEYSVGLKRRYEFH